MRSQSLAWLAANGKWMLGMRPYFDTVAKLSLALLTSSARHSEQRLEWQVCGCDFDMVSRAGFSRDVCSGSGSAQRLVWRYFDTVSNLSFGRLAGVLMKDRISIDTVRGSNSERWITV